MKTTLIAAMSANGLIAHSSAELVDWTSGADKAQFLAACQEAGVAIMGSHTWKTLTKPLPDCLNVVMSHSLTQAEGAEISHLSPQELLDDLERRGHNQAIIAGGGRVYTAFLAAGLVDELWLTVAPRLFALGVPLTGSLLADIDLELLEITPLGPSELRLRYGVRR